MAVKSGVEYLEAGEPYKALPLLRKAAKKQPGYENLLNLAAAHRACGEFDLAKETLAVCLGIDAKRHEAYNNLAQLATDEGKFTDACAYWTRCLQIMEAERGFERYPASMKQVTLAFACALMRFGEFEKAWPLWEYGRVGQSWNPFPGKPAWKGERVESLLVVCEGGFGDAFLFARWLPLAAERCKSVSVLLWPSLVEWADWHKVGITDDIAKASTPSETPLIVRGAMSLGSDIYPRYFDAMTSWMSLPGIFGMKNFADVPSSPWGFLRNSQSHLHSEGATCVEPVAGRTGGESAQRNLRVGFCWWAEENGAHRPCRRLDTYSANCVADALSDYGTVFSLVPDNASLYRHDQPWQPKRVEKNAENLRSWKATTEFMKTLDCVVSTDTAVAHLAGLLNIPCLLLIPLRSDWKWGVETDRGSWYPSLRYFRNPLPSWQQDKLRAAVQDFVKELPL